MKNIKELVHDLSQLKFELRDSIGLTNSETFGIEIEFENVNLEEIKNLCKWDIKADDSVTKENFGGEIVSPILIDNKETWGDIGNKCKYLKRKNAIATPRTGSHIHIGSQILKDNPDNIRKFLKAWELFENIIYYFSCGKDMFFRPTIKNFARPISKDLYAIRNSKRGYNEFKNYYDWYHFFQKQKFNKNAGLNFRNYQGYEMNEGNTIEIRCPNGTLDAKVWQNNINFFMKFMLKVTEDNFDEELIDYYLDKKDVSEYGYGGLNLLDIEKAIILSDIVFSDELDKLLFLKQYLKIFEEEKQIVKK